MTGNRLMKVLIVYHAAALEPSRAIFAALAKEPGIELKVLGPKKGWNPTRRIWLELPEIITQDGYTTAHGRGYKAKKDFSGPYLTGLIREMRRFRPDVIHIFNEPYSLITIQALLYRKLFLPSAKLCCLGIENIITKEPTTIREKFSRGYIINGCDAVSCWSASSAKALKQTGFPDNKLKIHYWGIPLDLFSSSKNHELRKKLFIGDSFVIGFVGRLVEEKGLLTVLEALEHLPTRVVLLCIGDGPFRQNFLDDAERRGLKKRVIWIQRVADNEVPAFMNAMDCLVLPSLTTPKWKEQFGRVIPEAMSCGLPVIGSDSGAIPEIIGDGGLIFSEHNGADLANCIKNIINDNHLYNELSAIGKQRAQAHFSVKAYAAKLCCLYTEVVGQ